MGESREEVKSLQEHVEDAGAEAIKQNFDRQMVADHRILRGRVPDRPEGWTAESCPHFYSMARMTQRPVPDRRGESFFTMTCLYGCGQTVELDMLLTSHMQSLTQRIEVLEAKIPKLQLLLVDDEGEPQDLSE